MTYLGLPNDQPQPWPQPSYHPQVVYGHPNWDGSQGMVYATSHQPPQIQQGQMQIPAQMQQAQMQPSQVHQPSPRWFTNGAAFVRPEVLVNRVESIAPYGGP